MSKLREGYKQTKVGVIPKEWEVVRLGDVFDFVKTYSNSRSHLSDLGEIEYIHYGDIHTKFKFHIDLKRVTLPKIAQDKIRGDIAYVEEGDLIIADASEDYSDIGKSIEIVNIGDKKVVSGLHTFLLRDKENNFTNGYKGFLLYNQNISKKIKKIATGISVLGISKTNLGKIMLPLPPLKEQQKIAQILSTWYRAIEQQESLITAKEELKIGLMQKLLSGEVRFEGFDEEWKEVYLENILFEPKKNKVNEPSNYELLTVKLHCKGIAKTGKMPNKTKNGRPYFFVEKGELLIGRQNFHNGGFGISNFESNKYITSNAISHYRAKKDKCDLYFVEYFFSQYNFYKKIDYIIGGTGQKEISKKEFLNLKIKLPPLKEQQKIAQVLTTADKEITLLKEELEALKEQKRGLMQKLLTGVVRVNNIEEKK